MFSHSEGPGDVAPVRSVGPGSSERPSFPEPGFPLGGPVPAVLRADRFAHHHARFVAEYAPVGPTELALVGDLARQVAEAEAWGAACGAVQRRAAVTAPWVASSLGADPLSDDAVLAAAMSADATDRCDRALTRHTRGFYRALGKLEEVQARRRAEDRAGGPAGPPVGFPDEASCEAYLVDRHRRGDARCRKCGATAGCYLPSRKAWECLRCGSQTGLRVGTVLHGSPLPLRPWFEAVRWLLWRPGIGTADLGDKIGVRRPTTVREVARRVRAAAAAADPTALLAGLDEHFARASIPP